MKSEIPCRPCKGTGKCKKCAGGGRAEVGFFSKKVINCPECKATGRCGICGGAGRLPDPGTGEDSPIWAVMQKQAEAAQQKDKELQEREEALKARGIDPRALEFEPILRKHMGGPLPEKTETASGGVI